MVMPDHWFLDLIQTKVRSWIMDLSGGGFVESWMSGGDNMMCYDCHSRLTVPICGYRCRSCGRMFCRKCMQSTGDAVGSDDWSCVAEDGERQPKFCNFCFQAVGREEAAVEYDDRMDLSMSPRRFLDDKLTRLVEVQQCSPMSLPCSTNRSDEEDEEDIGIHFWSPCSVFSQDASDIDSSSFRREFYSFKSLTSSPSRIDEQEERSPTFQKSCILDLESLGYLGTPRRENRDLLGHANDYTDDHLSIYQNCESQEAEKPLDFENNGLIWFPPPPEDEGDDVDNEFFGYDDEDDGVGDPGMMFSSSSFGSDTFPIKEKPNDANKELLRASVHGHFRALVSQLLKGEGIRVGNENGGEGWLEIVTSLAWQAANFVKPDTSRGSSMDPGDYVKVKCILSGSPSYSTLVKGVVCTKNVKHKRMISQHRNPKLLLLGGALEYQRVPNKLASIDAILQQEIDHLKMAVAKIEAHRPNVLLVEKSVSSYAQEYLLAKEISLVLNVKRTLLERISRCTGAQITASIDNLASTRLGHCEIFRVERVYEECSSGNQPNKRSNRTLMFFDGCAKRLGCTVLLRGTCREELKKVKHVVQFASFAAYHLSLETSFLADEGATLPKIPPNPLVDIPDGLVNADDSISMASNSAISSMHETNADESQGFCSSNKVGTTYLLPCPDVSSLNDIVLSINSEQEGWKSSRDYINPSSICSVNLADSQIKGVCSAASAPDLALHGTLYKGFGFQCDNLSGSLDLADVRTDEVELLEKVIEKGSTLGFRAVHEPKRTDIIDGDEVPVPGDYFPTSENHQSILVSLSRSCVLKGTICERSQLLRIKFYGSFDKPLGRYLRDDLFDQTSCCRSCKEPAEAHVWCYTHQQGSLTISVRRLPSLKLPGERDGRIWMWHRCLKCAHKDGVPPAARRVVMSDAAWGLSFGKFLELSFSNHATANRVASCGHSLQRDCLRFYGFGSMVAFFRYSPIDILSVRLPPSVLEFSWQIQQEWFRREAAEVSSKMDFLYVEVFEMLHSIEQKISGSAYKPLKSSLYNHVMELKDLLKRERHEYVVLLQPTILENLQPGKVALDILKLNQLRRCLLIDSYIWDRRIYLLDSFTKVKSSTTEADARLLGISTHINLKERSDSFCKDGRLDCSAEGTSMKSLKCNSNELISMDSSVKPVECYVGPSSLDLVSGENCSGNVLMDCEAPVESSSLGSLLSPGSSLSDKIDLAWTGIGHPVKVPPSGGLEDGSDNPCYGKAMSPVRVYSFDSALRIRDRIHRGHPAASFHLSSAKSFDADGDRGRLVRDPVPNIRRAYSQNCPRTTQNLNFLFGRMPLLVSSASRMVSEGARLLLPQTGHDNIVIAVYDKEPTSVISYALSSKEHEDFIACKSDQHEGWIENDRIKDGGNLLGYHMAASTLSPFELDDMQSKICGSDEALPSHRSLNLDPKRSHFRVSFNDESSIPAEKAKFSVTCYFAKQFDALRKKCCPKEMEFICSLSRCMPWNAQGGKSNVYFAKSLDERFIIKQVSKTELDSFEDYAPAYFKYLMESINSRSPTCLSKILGIYQVTVKHLKGGREVRMDLLVMENLFFRRSISRVYDLKGSSRSRYNSDTTGRNKVMLDLNLLEALHTKPIFLGSKAKRSLERAVWNDTSFLASVDVMDYSLLVGVDEERKELVLGIIDFLRQYTWDKHLETWVKASGILGGPKNVSPTVISPKQYKKRFRKAMSTYFLTVPDQWSS